jgi:hypothetical protein
MRNPPDFSANDATESFHPEKGDVSALKIHLAAWEPLR